MAARQGNFDRLLRMQATRGGQNDNVGRRGLEHFGQAQMPFGAGTLGCLVERGAVNIADIDDFDIVGMLLHGAKVVGRDASATDKRHADLAAGYGGVVSHFCPLRDGIP